ncbi:MAG: GNAT family N-acetyltransferase [Flavobacteriales bacterium]|jgi:ribosomal-protein-alanine N-acetyltransferase|nr:GNAT family N-acetyltransferase [Flavobacteriales bacterium]
MICPSGRFQLRPVQAEDKPFIHCGLSHPEVIKHYAVSFPTLEATQEQMDWYSDLQRNGTGQWWTIRSTEEAVFLGAIGLSSIDRKHRRCEVGFWLLPEHWRKGIIREVLPMVIEYAFGTLGLHRIMAEVETDNPASAKALSFAGFTHEGTLHECEWKDGRSISLDVFALLNKA